MAENASDTDVSVDLLSGADDIALFLFGNRALSRRVYHLRTNSNLPIQRVGWTLNMRKSEFIEWFEARERRAANDNTKPIVETDKIAEPNAIEFAEDLVRGASEIALLMYGDRTLRRRVYQLRATPSSNIPIVNMGSMLYIRKSKYFEWRETRDLRQVPANDNTKPVAQTLRRASA